MRPVFEARRLVHMSFFRRPWFLIFVGGLVLFGVADLALFSTADPNYIPTVLLIGAFLIPVSFVAYTLQRAPANEIPLGAVAITFLWGGVLGVVVAGFLEYSTLRALGAAQLIGVGFIEESVKLIIPIAIFIRGRYRHEADGLLFGIAAGMGFAALESMGYGFTTYIQSHSDTGILLQTLLVRGLLSPAGHAAWTGIACAALWRERQRLGHAAVTWTVAGYFLLAVALHSFWGIFFSVNISFFEWVGLIVVGVVSFWLLVRRMRSARHTEMP
jgi:protease PrsW